MDSNGRNQTNFTLNLKGAGAETILKARDALQEVVQFLGQEAATQETSTSQSPPMPPPMQPAVPGPSSSSSASNGPRPHMSQSSTSARNSRQGQVNVLDRQLDIRQSFASLFSPYQRTTSLASASGRQRSASSVNWARAGGSGSSGGKRPRFTPKETWTHDFFCLANTNTQLPPNRNEKEVLQDAGLGRKKLCFDKKGDALHVKQALEAAYPKLHHGGGFEILRSGSGPSQPMKVLMAPTSGYSVNYLRDVSGLGQALAYLRPIQRNLDTSPPTSPATNSGQPESSNYDNAPKVDCFICGMSLPITQIKDHTTTCKSQDSEEAVAIATVMDVCGRDREETMQALESSEWNTSEAICVLTEAKSTLEVEDSWADIGLHPTSVSLAEKGPGKAASTQEIIEFYQKKNIDCSDEVTVVVNREEVWKCALTFYKLAMKSPERLSRTLFVEFQNEEGIDGGALRLEFFELVLQEIKQRFFEGDNNLIPRRSLGGAGFQLHLSGMMIAHSIMQDGPSFPFLASWVYDYLVEGETESVMDKILLSDITKGPSTADLLQFVKALDEAETNEDVNDILDDSNPSAVSYWQQINMSNWNTGEVINLKNKSALIKELVVQEAFHRRKAQLQFFKDGLKALEFLSMLQAHPEKLQLLLVKTQQNFTAEEFVNLIENKDERPAIHAEGNAFDWFMEYILEADDEKTEEFPEGKLNTILHFCTGLWQVPPTGLRNEISIKYLEDDDEKEFPEAIVCSAIILLPVVHSSKKIFDLRFNSALRLGHSGFGNY